MLPSFTARQSKIFMDGAPLVVRGVNWFGFEGANGILDGLWVYPVAEYLRFLATYGFNALRIPLAIDHIASNPRLKRELFPQDPGMLELAKAGGRYLDALERVVDLAAHAGLLVCLDMHRLKAATWPDPDGLWYRTPTTAKGRGVDDTLLAAWDTVLGRFCGKWNFAFADLFVRSGALERAIRPASRSDVARLPLPRHSRTHPWPSCTERALGCAVGVVRRARLAQRVGGGRRLRAETVPALARAGGGRR